MTTSDDREAIVGSHIPAKFVVAATSMFCIQSKCFITIVSSSTIMISLYRESWELG
jgi:hypothetical protein